MCASIVIANNELVKIQTLLWLSFLHFLKRNQFTVDTGLQLLSRSQRDFCNPWCSVTLSCNGVCTENPASRFGTSVASLSARQVFSQDYGVKPMFLARIMAWATSFLSSSFCSRFRSALALLHLLVKTCHLFVFRGVTTGTRVRPLMVKQSGWLVLMLPKSKNLLALGPPGCVPLLMTTAPPNNPPMLWELWF